MGLKELRLRVIFQQLELKRIKQLPKGEPLVFFACLYDFIPCFLFVCVYLQIMGILRAKSTFFHLWLLIWVRSEQVDLIGKYFHAANCAINDSRRFMLGIVLCCR